MSRLFLFEAGSTKTTLLSADLETGNSGLTPEVIEYQLGGYNPNRPSLSFVGELQELSMEKGDRVLFYGSGMGSDHNKANLKKMFSGYDVEVTVFDDLLGAARALCYDHEGLIGVMGTGGCVAYYDGNKIIDRNGGYGYLIDDLGGGYELGKRVLSAWLNNDLPQEMDTAVQELVCVEKSEFIKTFYVTANASMNEALELTADVVKIVPEFLNHAKINLLVMNYFENFMVANVVPLAREKRKGEMSLVGSVATVFEKQIAAVAQKNGIAINKVVRYPALNLLNYHLRIKQEIEK